MLTGRSARGAAHHASAPQNERALPAARSTLDETTVRVQEGAAHHSCMKGFTNSGFAVACRRNSSLTYCRADGGLTRAVAQPQHASQEPKQARLKSECTWSRQACARVDRARARVGLARGGRGRLSPRLPQTASFPATRGDPCATVATTSEAAAAHLRWEGLPLPAEGRRRARLPPFAQARGCRRKLQGAHDCHHARAHSLQDLAVELQRRRVGLLCHARQQVSPATPGTTGG